MSAAFDAAVTRALGGVHTLFGRAATYTPPAGAPIACKVVLDAADAREQLLQTNAVLAQRVVDVRKSDVAAPVKGGVFTIGTESLKIVSAPRSDDPDALVWTCLCSPY